MATELAAAYVTIIPSLKGATKQIQTQLSGVDTASAGSAIGANLSGNIGRNLNAVVIGAGLKELGGKISDVGSSLTKKITAPAVIAGGAVAGITAALGWKRLSSLDTAQAQLRGLGYEASDVERISEQVTSAVSTGMTTMAEGTAVAAGALAAGVKEGAELERYIKLVGDAAVGANRPVGEMAQIFNRVQGSGKLMTQELNMIEDGMPGFAATMAESLGVPQEEFRKMVTAGEVSSGQFMGVMEGFAGGMADEYAKSWDGMVANTKSFIGIIGENILKGVFQDSKVELGNFTEFLQSEEVITWAQDVGSTVTEWFGKIVDAVKGVIDWWTGLSPAMQKTIGIAAGVAVAIGPVLSILGGIVSGVGTLVTVGGAMFKVIKVGTGIFKALNMVMMANPIGLIITAIAALVAGLIWFFSSTELGQEIWAKFTTFLTEAWTNITTFLSETWANITQWFTDFGTNISNAWTTLWTNVGTFLSEAWANIKQFFLNVLQWVVDAFMNWTVYGLIIKNWDAIVDFFKSVPEKIMGFFSGIGTWLLDSGKALIQGFIDGITTAFNWAKDKVSDGLGAIRDLFPFSPAKTGPFSGSGWVDRSGAALGSTFAESVADSLKAGRKDVSSELSGIQSDFDGLGSDFQAGFRVSSAVPDVVGAAGRGGVQQVNNFAHLDPEIAVEMSARRLERELEAV